MQELLNTYRQFVKDRLSSPFFANFIFSWSIFNWEVIYTTLFLTEKAVAPLSKIDYIKANYSEPNQLFLYPILTAVGVTLMLPLFNMLVFGWREFVRKLKKKLSFNINKTTPISNEAHWAVSNRLEQVEKKYTESINNYKGKETEIATLKFQNEEWSTRNQDSIKLKDEINKEYQSLIAKHSLPADFFTHKFRLVGKPSNNIIAEEVYFENENVMHYDKTVIGDISMIEIINEVVHFRAIMRLADKSFLDSLDFYSLKKMDNSYGYSGTLWRKRDHVMLPITIHLLYH